MLMDETKEITMKELAEMDKRPQYFNLFLESCETLAMLDNEGAGKVIHAIADYFIDGEPPEDFSTFTKSERRAYTRIKRGCDDSCALWYKKAVGGKLGAERRWGNKTEETEE